MELSIILNKRFSCRSYTDDKVSDDIILTLVEACSLAPSSCNLQLTQYIFVNDDNLLIELSRKANSKFSWAPNFLIILRDSRLSNDRNAGVISSGMAAENFLLKIVDLGMSACPMTGFNNDKIIKDMLNIPIELDIDMIISFGFCSESPKKNKRSRIDLKDVYSLNSYGNLKTLNISENISDHSILDIINYRRRIASVYLDRFRLNSWSNKFYDDVYVFFKKYVLPKISSGNILDLMTYDANFVKLMFDEKINSRFNIIVSDYLKDNIDFCKERFNCDGVLINNDNSVDLDDDCVDLLTFIFQAEFTPYVSSLINNVNKKIRKNGYLFIATINEVWYKKTLKRINRIIRFDRSFNIYENNPYYKIGPIDFISVGKMKKILKNNNMVILDFHTSGKSYRNGLRIDLYLAQKR